MPHPRLKNLNRNLPGFNHLDFKELHRETQMDIVNKMAKRAKKRSEKSNPYANLEDKLDLF